MDRKKIEIIITGVLVVVLVVMIAGNLKPKRKKRPPSKPSKVKQETLALLSLPKGVKRAPKASSKELEKQRKRASLEWGIDPFYHSLKREVYKSSMLVLKGISVGKDKRGYAFINDEIVTVGDEIAGYKVVKVEKDKVLLKRGGESFYLALPEE